MSGFKDHVVWITGGGSGIGEALALEFAHRGARIAVSGRRLDRLQQVAATIESNGGQCLAVPCDVCDDGQVQAAVAAVVERFGQLDVAIANAGYGVAGPFEEVDAEMWRRQLDVNVTGAAMTIRHALPHLEQVAGRAVVISSILGKFSIAGSAPYCASKFALVGMCNALHLELAKSDVSVTNVLPGLVVSEISKVDNHGQFREDWRDRRPALFMWTSQRAAKVIAKAIWRRKREFIFTGHGQLITCLAQYMPGLMYWLMRVFSVRGRG